MAVVRPKPKSQPVISTYLPLICKLDLFFLQDINDRITRAVKTTAVVAMITNNMMKAQEKCALALCSHVAEADRLLSVYKRVKNILLGIAGGGGESLI